MCRQMHEWQLHTLLFDLEICDLCFLCCFLLPATLLLLLIFGGCCTFWIPYLCSWILNTTFLLVPSGTMCLNSGFLYFNSSVSYPFKGQEIVYLPSASRSLVHWSIWIVKLSLHAYNKYPIGICRWGQTFVMFTGLVMES
jgi:hypothetical protein